MHNSNSSNTLKQRKHHQHHHINHISNTNSARNHIAESDNATAAGNGIIPVTESQLTSTGASPFNFPPMIARNTLNSSGAAVHRGEHDSPISSEETDIDLKPGSRYECAICIHWLNEPVLTTCGHRFCKSCLNAWLRNHNQCCPLDNKQLSPEQDIFPDNFTRREIEQMKLNCPNTGCTVYGSPIEVDRHLPMCPYRVQLEDKCPFASVKCGFVGRPETNAVEEHLKNDMPHHLQLMLQAYQQTALATWNPQKPKHGGGPLPPPPLQYANEADEQYIQAMYKRIVVLEQQVREQDVQLENLSKQLTSSLRVGDYHVDPHYSNGTIIWTIDEFQTLVEHLRANANHQVYSSECYTSPYGYKFCARLNIQPRREHLLSLHVHLMQSENDHHLEWPFKGRMKLCMIHPRDSNLSQHDTIMTKPEIQAFLRPQEPINKRGFGFIEYANIADILHKGFCDNGRLVIKIQINIV